jgi:radical SAM protein with 4Fe4S-binding SPASM domain
MCPCPGLIRDDRYYLGTIHGTHDLKETLESNEAIANLSALHVDHNPRAAKCSECDVRYFCGGWCLGRDIPEESCQWIRRRLGRRLWKYRDGLPLQANVEAMFGEG